MKNLEYVSRVGESNTRRSMGYRFKRHLTENWRLHLMALPTIICLALFSYMPMFGLIMAFQNFNFGKGFLGSELVGLSNFRFLFASNSAWIITRNTVLYNIVFIVLGTSCAVALSLIVSEMYFKRLGKVLQTVFIMPYFLSITVVALIVYSFISPSTGYVNSLLKSMGKSTQNWYVNPSIWPYLLVGVYLWKGVGFSAIVYLASISGISHEYYEAAMIDGAKKMQQIVYITIPQLRTIISIQLILAIGGMFRGDFGLFYNVTMNNGALYNVTDVIDTYVFRALMTQNNIGMATAAGLYQSVVGFVLILFANKVVTKLDSDSALF